MTKPDCKLGIGYNANMLISEIYAKSPEYLRLVYNDEETPQGVKEVIKHYIVLPEMKAHAGNSSINAEKSQLIALNAALPIDVEKITINEVQSYNKNLNTKIKLQLNKEKKEMTKSDIKDEPMTDAQVDELIHEQEVQAQEPSVDLEKLKKDKDKKEKREMAKSEKVKEETVILQPTCLLAKINAIRQAWSATEVEKTGKGKAGGGAKYDYYKPQQVIDFCLAQEVKYDLFSEFKINVETGFCSYVLIDIPTGETRSVECPFDIPRKMAASEAQQVGAAMTYHNRRLAMMMYKIEDNSKENVNVLEDADYSAPSIPAPPTIPTPPIGNQIIPPLPPSTPVSEPKKVEDEIQVDEPDVAEIAEQMAQAEEKAVTPPPAPKVEATIPSTKLPDMSAYSNQKPPMPPAPPVKEPVKEPKLVNGQTPYMAPSDVMSGNKKSIEDLYS